MYTTYAEAEQALRAAEEDVANDMGEEAVEAGYYDIVHSVASECAPDVRRELLRCELGEGVEL